MKTPIYILVGILIILSGCASVQKMIDEGDFEAALLKSVRKVSGKNKPKERYVRAIEEAFENANNRDLSEIRRLQTLDRRSAWNNIIAKYDRIQHRQNVIRPFLPIISREGSQAQFTFIQVDEPRADAVNRYVDLTFKQGMERIFKARDGDKNAAHFAHELFDNLLNYVDDYKNARQLKAEASQLGISHVQVFLKNNLFYRLSREIERDLLHRSFPDQKWTKYHWQTSSELEMDYEIVLTLQDLEISPERFSEHTYIESKKIKDGFRYELDDRGNVRKDSSGNDIKKPVFTEISAEVTKVRQFKAATLVGDVRIRSTENDFEDQIPVRSQIVFDHEGATFKGDRRALTPESKKCLRSGPIPFPPDQYMLADAVERLEGIIRNDVLANFPT